MVRPACRVFSLVHAPDEVYAELFGHSHERVRVHAASMLRGDMAFRFARELRYILFKIEEEMYGTEETHLCGGWYAIRTDDQKVVRRSAACRDPTPVTKNLGGEAWNNDRHAWAKDEEHVRCGARLRHGCVGRLDGVVRRGGW